jgi:hypothetical protein
MGRLDGAVPPGPRLSFHHKNKGNSVDFVIFVVVGVVAWIAFRIYSAGQGAGGRGTPTPQAFLNGNGNFDLEIVGESNYQPALRRVCGPGKVRHECKAILVLEDDNPHDKKAVRVDINGDTVGYLSREAAREYRKGLKKAGHPELTAECNAIIIGGGKGRDSVGVWLDLPVEE